MSRAPALQQLETHLRAVNAFADAAALMVHYLQRDIGVSGVVVLPLMAGANPQLEIACHSSEVATEIFQREFFHALPTAERELGAIATQFPRGLRTYDINEKIGNSTLMRTTVYNEWWRPMHVEREVLALLGSPSTPLGFIAICRKATDPPFDESEIDRIDDARQLLESFAVVESARRQGWFGLDVVSLAFRGALPFPCGVFDCNGAPLWLNDLAGRALGTLPTHPAGLILGGVGSARVPSWGFAVREVHERNVLSSVDARLGVSIRRVDRSGQGPVYVVSQVGANRQGGCRLTARESEVADLAGRGYSVLNIAQRLGLTEGTVRNHLKKVYKKLGVCNRAELARVVLGESPRIEK